MDSNTKTHLRVIECTIKEACHAKDEYDLFRFVAAMSKREKELLRALSIGTNTAGFLIAGVTFGIVAGIAKMLRNKA